MAKDLNNIFVNALNRESIDSVCSTEWIGAAGLLGESEGFIFTIQDKVIHTRIYQKHIMGINCIDKYRLCKNTMEFIQHICSGCPALAQKDYLERHNSLSGQSSPSGSRKAIYGLNDTELPY
jgi:hypothetical protein